MGEDRRALRVDADCQVVGQAGQDVLLDCTHAVPVIDHLVVGNDEVGVQAHVLQPDAVHQGAEVVTDVQLAGGTIPGEDSPAIRMHGKIGLDLVATLLGTGHGGLMGPHRLTISHGVLSSPLVRRGFDAGGAVSLTSCAGPGTGAATASVMGMIIAARGASPRARRPCGPRVDGRNSPRGVAPVHRRPRHRPASHHMRWPPRSCTRVQISR